MLCEGLLQTIYEGQNEMNLRCFAREDWVTFHIVQRLNSLFFGSDSLYQVCHQFLCLWGDGGFCELKSTKLNFISNAFDLLLNFFPLIKLSLL